jgi:hypothetical protein
VPKCDIFYVRQLHIKVVAAEDIFLLSILLILQNSPSFFKYCLHIILVSYYVLYIKISSYPNFFKLTYHGITGISIYLALVENGPFVQLGLGNWD